jgi:hypothetical protein
MKTEKPAIPDGYRRVSNGYTRPGDFVWIDNHVTTGWVVAKELEPVAKMGIVIRPKVKPK